MHFVFESVDPRSPTPLYWQIASVLQDAISSGLINAGDLLPSVRTLAVRLRVNPATIVQAYRSLESEGFVNTKHGVGTFVQRVPAKRRKDALANKATTLVRKLLVEASRIGIPKSMILATLNSEVDQGDP